MAGHHFGELAGEGNSPLSGLEAHDAAVVGGQPVGASQVGADAERRQSGGNRRSLSAAGATGRLVGVPRIHGLAEYLIGGLGPQSEFREVGLSQQDGSGLLEAANRGGILSGNAALEQFRSAGGPDSGSVETVFGGKGDSMQGPPQLAPHHGGLGLARTLPASSRQGDDGIQPGIEGSDALQVGIQNLHRRKRLGADPLRLTGQTGVTDVRLGHGASRSVESSTGSKAKTLGLVSSTVARSQWMSGTPKVSRRVRWTIRRRVSEFSKGLSILK